MRTAADELGVVVWKQGQPDNRDDQAHPENFLPGAADAKQAWHNRSQLEIRRARQRGLMSRPLQTAGLEEAGRGAPGARKELQNPCPESIRIAHTVTSGVLSLSLSRSSLFPPLLWVLPSLFRSVRDIMLFIG